MKTKALTRIELVVAIATMTFATGTLTAALNGPRQTAVRLICQTNLTGLGRAMTVYAGDSAGDFPRAGGPGGIWRYGVGAVGVILDWQASTEHQAFDYDLMQVPPKAGEATITSSFYLLVKYYKVEPKQFVCKGDAGAMEFKLAHFPMAWPPDAKIKWDFGGAQVNTFNIYPGEFVSYAYHMPYSKTASDRTSFGISRISHPASPVCADRNPFLDKNAPEWPDPNYYHEFNSTAHQGKGQNILYKDGSVKFENSPTVGIGGDNIYTYGGEPASGGGDPNGTPPNREGDVPSGFPQGEKDAYLLSERNYYGL